MQENQTVLDCSEKIEIVLPESRPRSSSGIVTYIVPGQEMATDDLLGSLAAHGDCQDSPTLVFLFDKNQEALNIIEKYQAFPVHCSSASDRSIEYRTVFSMAARVADFGNFLCISPDMLVLDSVKPLLCALDVCQPLALLACRKGERRTGEMVAKKPSAGATMDSSLFVGRQSALIRFDELIRALYKQVDGFDTASEEGHAELFTRALSQMPQVIELDSIYNIPLSHPDLEVGYSDGRMRAHLSGRTVKALNFVEGEGNQYKQWRGHFARISDPLVGIGNGDGYNDFVTALRGWIGRYGMAAMAWSFYGSADATQAYIRDPSTMPIFACLHYLIRANGCVRVLETGTARGVSAACLASAVAHRQHARVVTIDPHPRTERYAERWELWAALPERMQACIEARQNRSLESLQAALEAGEMYDAILLDSIHSEEYVWAEFQLAIQLLHPGGLLFIHDATLTFGTVDRALIRIEGAGYNVTRLWAAESGVFEEDHLGLAVIENRRRSTG